MKAPIDNLQFGNVIVGGGSAGLPARPLSVGHSGLRVLLIEARQPRLILRHSDGPQNHPDR